MLHSKTFLFSVLWCFSSKFVSNYFYSSSFRTVSSPKPASAYLSPNHHLINLGMMVLGRIYTTVSYFHFSDISSLSRWSFNALKYFLSSFNTEVCGVHYLVHSQFRFQKMVRRTTELQENVYFGNLGSSFTRPLFNYKISHSMLVFCLHNSQSIFLLLLLLQTSLHWPSFYKILSPLLLVLLFLTTKSSSLIPKFVFNPQYYPRLSITVTVNEMTQFSF